ncbi:hypothetical protein VT1337_09537 [Vibrio tubiashii NCIMB 1337 = ATCC 19106]|nr:hypothetical protein VT1337_09537 [Vibrio tubiashii NCIMB 1337 = ATCC 19106]
MFQVRVFPSLASSKASAEMLRLFSYSCQIKAADFAITKDERAGSWSASPVESFHPAIFKALAEMLEPFCFSKGEYITPSSQTRFLVENYSY